MHPAAKRDTATPAPPTGIDYLALVRDRHTQILTAPLAYADLARPTTGQATAAALGPDLSRVCTYDERMADAATGLGMVVVAPA